MVVKTKQNKKQQQTNKQTNKNTSTGEISTFRYIFPKWLHKFAIFKENNSYKSWKKIEVGDFGSGKSGNENDLFYIQSFLLT